MTYHKIPGVPLNVCTAEQMIAYNLAFRAHISFGEKYKKAASISRICAEDLGYQILRFEITDYQRNNPKGKYDIDAISAALHSGLHDYLLNHFIATSYETVGKSFPAHYL